MYKQIVDAELLDEEFFEFLEKKLDFKVVEELQIKFDFNELTKYHHKNIDWE